MKLVGWLIVALIMVPAGWGDTAWAVGFEAAVNIWEQEADGYLGYRGGGDTYGLKDGSGYGREHAVGGRIHLDLPVLPSVFIMATPMDFSGTGVMGAAFTFGGQTYAANIPFSSELGLDHYDLGFYYGVPLLETASLNTLNIDFGIEARLLEIRATLRQEATGRFSRVEEDMYFPMGYLAVQLRLLERLALEAELRGFGYQGNHCYDLIGRVRYYLPGPVFLAGGWRYQELELDAKDILAEVSFSGPYFQERVGGAPPFPAAPRISRRGGSSPYFLASDWR